MKKYIAGIATGVLLSCTFALAVNYNATENPFPVQLNGSPVNIEGYNIDGSTYFKLRDVADTVGGFDVDFQNNTILLSKDGYIHETTPTTTFSLDDETKDYLAMCCIRIPEFTQADLKNKTFIEDFIFYFYTGVGDPNGPNYSNGRFAWSEDTIKQQYKLLFGAEMPDCHPTDNQSILYNNGIYEIGVSNYGDIKYTFKEIINTDNGIDVVYTGSDGSGEYVFGTTTLHLIPADNENGYIITSKSSSNTF